MSFAFRTSHFALLAFQSAIVFGQRFFSGGREGAGAAGTEGGGEGVVEVADVVEVGEAVVGGLGEQAGADEGVDDFAEVEGLADAPEVQDLQRQGAVVVEGLADEGESQFFAADVAEAFFFVDYLLQQAFEGLEEPVVGLRGVAGVALGQAGYGVADALVGGRRHQGISAPAGGAKGRGPVWV